MPTEIRPRTTTTTTTTSTSTSTSTKPLTPALSSNLRSRPATGFAPRLAGSNPTSPAIATPRTLRQQTLSQDRNDAERPLSLNSNVTPRSGARISRIDIDSPSTPDTATRNLLSTTVGPGQDDAQSPSYGLGIASPLQTPVPPRPKSTELLSFLPTANGRRISGGSNSSSVKDESKFFRADDMRSPIMSKLNNARPKTTYFAQSPTSRVPPKKAADAGPKVDEKFFYASNASTQQAFHNPRSILTMKLSTTPSAASSTRSLPLQTKMVSPAITRPPTMSSMSSISSTNHPVPAPSVSPRATSNTGSNISSTADRRRSSSLNIHPLVNGTGLSHRKSLSTSSTAMTVIATDVTHEQSPDSRVHFVQMLEEKVLATSPIALVSPDCEIPKQPTSETAILAPAHPTVTEFPPRRPQMQPRHTRGSSETTSIQPLTKQQIDAAANARRERKVLDLEISNSSLLAINRTLEKELRKQNTELRRFRRLSRSGRLSLTPSNRILSSASLSTLGTLDEAEHDSSQMASPASSDPGSPDDEDDFISDDDSAYTESSDAMRRRARDEKRLIQDLQRHQQLLLDSQKLSQSIQRCLNCTEELIKDGQKALAYHVEANELQLGGRVLIHDDDEALSEVDIDEYKESMTQPRRGLLSPTITKDTLQEAAMWANGLQTLDSSDKLQSLLPEKSIVESPSPTLDLSPIILPEK